MIYKSKGFTLVELLVAVAVAAVLATMAVPSFRTMLVKRTTQAAADALVGDFRYARSEAIKRSTRTSVCRSTDGATCTAVVGSWHEGWIVFVDMNSNGAVDSGDDIVRVQQQLPGIASIQLDSTPSNTRQIFKFEPAGWAKAADQTFNITPNGSDGATMKRLVCVSINGRAALRAEGATSCS